MEYKKDKRTKNLTLRDIFVGDWVQVWSKITERYSPPLKIIQICDDGTIYLVTSDEEKCTPWEENIKDVDALPITPELLKGFGFEIRRNYGDFIFHDEFILYNVILNKNIIGENWRSTICERTNWAFKVYYKQHYKEFKYMHELVGYLLEREPDVKLEWKGIE